MQTTTFVKDQNKRVKEPAHLEIRQENIKGHGRKICYTTEFNDLAQSDQVHPPAALDPVISFKGNNYIRGCVTCWVLVNL